MVAAFPQSKSPSFRKGPRIRDQGFEYAIRGSKTEKWRKTAKERGSDASPAVVTYSVTYFLSRKPVKDCMMSDIQKNDQFVPFITPNNSDVHINAAFEQMVCSLNAFCPKRGMERIVRQEFDFCFDLFLLNSRQFLQALLKSFSICDFVLHITFQGNQTIHLRYRKPAVPLKQSWLLFR